MKKQCTILMLGLLVAAVFTGVLWAEREREEGEVRGTFVRLAEQEVGEREHLAIIIKPVESDDHLPILVPRKDDFLQAARMLQEGDKVEIVFVVEEGQRWLKTIKAERRRESVERRRVETKRRREDVEERRDVRSPRPERDVEERDRPRRDIEPRRDPERREADELQGMFRRLWERLDRMERELKELLEVRMERMERELKELRAENARLRRQLQERRVLLRTEPSREVRRQRDIEVRRETREREEARPLEEARRERSERRQRIEQREREESRQREEQREREETREREEQRERGEGREREERE